MMSAFIATAVIFGFEISNGSMHFFVPDADGSLDAKTVFIVQGPEEQLEQLRELGSDGADQ